MFDSVLLSLGHMRILSCGLVSSKKQDTIRIITVVIVINKEHSDTSAHFLYNITHFIL